MMRLSEVAHHRQKIVICRRQDPPKLLGGGNRDEGDPVGSEFIFYPRPCLLFRQSYMIPLLYLATKVRRGVPAIEGPLWHKNFAFGTSGVGSVPLLQDHNFSQTWQCTKGTRRLVHFDAPPPDTPLLGTGVVKKFLVRRPKRSCPEEGGGGTPPPVPLYHSMLTLMVHQKRPCRYLYSVLREFNLYPFLLPIRKTLTRSRVVPAPDGIIISILTC